MQKNLMFTKATSNHFFKVILIKISSYLFNDTEGFFIMQKSKKQIKTIENSLTMCLFKSVLIGIFGFVIFLAIFSIVILESDFFGDKFFIMVLIASFLSVMIASITSSVLIKKGKFVAGMFSAIIITIAEFIVFLCFNNIDLSVKVYLMFPIDIISGVIGSVAGSNIRR